MVPCLWKLVKNWGYRDYLKIHSKYFVENHDIILKIKHHQELPQNNFRLICESLRITPQIISEWFANHWKLPRITPKTISDWFANHWELPQKRFQNGSQITENHLKTISVWFANHWELPRISENHPKKFRLTNHWELMRIIKNCPKNDFRVVHKS